MDKIRKNFLKFINGEVVMDRYLSAGEFAKLCRVKKDTILYYDKIGLLKPDFINEKKYRYYSISKYWQMSRIKMLQDIGMSLDAIKDYQSDMNEKKLYAMTEKQIEYYKSLIKKFEFNIKCCQEGLKLYRYLQQANFEKFFIYDSEEEYYIYTKAKNMENDDNFIDFIEDYNKHRKYYFDNDMGYSFIEGGVCYFSDIAKGFGNDFFISKIFEKVDSDNLLIKPQGKYLCYIHKGPWEDFNIIWEKFSKYIEDNSLEIVDDLFYGIDLVNYVDTKEMAEYVCKYEICIK